MKKALHRLLLLATGFILLYPMATLAQAKPLNGFECGLVGLRCNGAVGFIAFMVARIINIFLSLAGLVAVIYIIYGGFRYIASRGDDKEVEAAKYTIMYAVLGLIVIGLSAVIVYFILGAIS